MTERARIFLLIAITALVGSSSASAAIFEMQHASPGMDTAGARLRLPGNVLEGLYATASIDQGKNLPLPSAKASLPGPEDILWVAIGEAGPLGFAAAAWPAGAALPPAEAQGALSHALVNTAGAPGEGAAPEIWAVVLIAASLVWFQLRRKSRPGAIRFRIQ